MFVWLNSYIDDLMYILKKIKINNKKHFNRHRKKKENSTKIKVVIEFLGGKYNSSYDRGDRILGNKFSSEKLVLMENR